MATSTSVRPSNVFVYGYYGRGNFGDDVIQTILDRELRCSGLSVAFSVPTQEQTTPLRVVSRARSIVSRLWREWIDTDVVILGGGGVVKDSSIAGGLSLSLSLLPIWAHLLAGRPLVIVGVGVGPIRDEMMHKWIQLLCRVASGIYVRDPRSARVLAECGVNPALVNVRADLFFAEDSSNLAPEAPPRNRQILAMSYPDLYWYCCEHGIDPRGAAHTIASAMLGILDPDVPVEIASLSLGDIKFINHHGLRQELEAVGYTTSDLDLAAMAANEVIDLMRRARVVVASRYHALAAAALAGAAVLIIPLDPKLSNLADQLGLGNSVFNPSHLANQGQVALPAVSCASKERTTDLSHRARRMCEEVRDLLTNGDLKIASLGDKIEILGAVLVAMKWGARRRLGRSR